MCKEIKRKDPTKPGFFYISYQFPHPPLVPLQTYLDMYEEAEIDLPFCGDWVDDSTIMHLMEEMAMPYDDRDIIRAKRAFYAQCTLIDHQIRLLIGTLRECNLLDDTIIGFISDHGDSLFNHKMVAKRSFYDGSVHVPFILSGKPLAAYRSEIRTDVVSLEDVMPTLLDLCGIEIPESVEGISLVSEKRHDMIYGEVSEGQKATRMAHDDRYKLIYYPCGNVFQLFDHEVDPCEMTNLHGKQEVVEVESKLMAFLIDHLYGEDLKWIKEGKLVGFEAGFFERKADYGLYNQRGYHWPAPNGYSNIGKNA
jgi:arylsulfatase A-like enzyme